MKNYSSDFVNICIKNNIRFNLAESCTGGLISSKLVAIKNVSKVYEFGIVTYSNESKQSLLKVPRNTLKKHGAVSEQTAEAMVKTLSNNSKIDFSFAITGIAGPGGGTIEKPIGLVYHSFYFKKIKRVFIIKKIYNGYRNIIRENAASFSIYKSYIIIKSIV